MRMDMMALRRSIIMAIIGGGGDMLPDKEFLVKTTTEMTLKDFLTANPIKLKYRDEMCWLRFYNDTAATDKGTANWMLFQVQNGNVKKGITFNYTNSTVAINTMDLYNTALSLNGNYFTISDGYVTSNNGYYDSWKVASGTDAYVLHIPFNWANFNMQTTEV